MAASGKEDVDVPQHRFLKDVQNIKVTDGRKMGLIMPNVDLTTCHDWSIEDKQVLIDAIHDNGGVLAFTNQKPSLSVNDHAAFANLFGTPAIHAAVEGLPGYPQITEIVRETSAETIFGEEWHSDLSFYSQPASFSILRMTGECTPYGTNNTQCVNTIHAWKDFSPWMKQQLLPLEAYHSCIKAYGNPEVYGPETGAQSTNSLGAMQQTKTMKLADQLSLPNDVLHPVVTVHPDTGKECPFVSSTFTNGIKGMPLQEGRDLIQAAQDLMVEEKYLFEVPHEPHQVTMWDNRQLIHRALCNDRSCRRVIHRISIGMGMSPLSAFKHAKESTREDASAEKPSCITPASPPNHA